MSENQPEQTTPSAEQQPTQQPVHATPEQPAPDPAQVPTPAPAEQVPPAGDPNETTDTGNGAGDQPTASEEAAVVDVTEDAPPENPHGGGEGEGSPGFGVSGKFVHDEAPGDEDAGDQ